MSGSTGAVGLSPAVPPTHPWRTGKDAVAVPLSSDESWWHFSAACWHFAEAVTDAHVKAGKAPPTLGLINTAIGGSVIEEWITDEEAQKCVGYQKNANGGLLNHVCWDSNVRPFLDFSIKGALYYQVRARVRDSVAYTRGAQAHCATRTTSKPPSPPPSDILHRARTMRAACTATARPARATVA